eukprot:3918931-Rhodomonas_salina.1
MLAASALAMLSVCIMMCADALPFMEALLTFMVPRDPSLAQQPATLRCQQSSAARLCLLYTSPSPRDRG